MIVHLSIEVQAFGNFGIFHLSHCAIYLSENGWNN